MVAPGVWACNPPKSLPRGPPREGAPLGTTRDVLGIGFPRISLVLLGFPRIISGFLRISYDSLIFLIGFPRILIRFLI